MAAIQEDVAEDVRRAIAADALQRPFAWIFFAAGLRRVTGGEGVVVEKQERARRQQRKAFSFCRLTAERVRDGNASTKMATKLGEMVSPLAFESFRSRKGEF